MLETESRSPPILFLIDTLMVGGSEKKTVAVSTELVNRGRRVHIAYLNPPAPLADRVDSRVPLVCLERRGKLSFAAIERLAEYVRVHEIRLILCVNLYPMAYALAVQRMRPRNALSFDVLINVTDFVSLKHHVQMLVYRCVLSRARRIVFGCQAQLAKWRRVYRLNGAMCTHIYNGVDLDIYRSGVVTENRDEWLRKWGLDPSAFIVGTIGRLRKEKNHQDLIRVLGRLVAQGVDAQCLIVGDGPERDALRAMAARLGLRDRIVFAGALGDVRPALLAMDVFVLTSKAVETFSNAALEAMAMARPVVLSDVGGAREMIAEGANGYIYPKGDVDRLGQILKLIHDRPDLRRALGDAGRVRVEERYSFSHMVDEYEHLAFGK
ncbi:MAG: glycosyltransferase [Gammaproteobacteria bacterium]